MYFTPTSGSPLNLAEVVFPVITRQAVRRGGFAPVRDLIAAIGNFTGGRNGRCHLFTGAQDRRRDAPALPHHLEL